MTVAEDLRAGRLEQACPDCGVWEAAGEYCTGCRRRMGPDDWYRNGDEERRAVAQDAAPAVFTDGFLARFWAKVSKDADGCWRWTAATTDAGYGVIGAGGHAGQLLRAHRVSWQIANGRVPAGMYVCHTCDNPGCVNPDHLWLGTNADNQNDAVAKGRIKSKPKTIGPTRPVGRPRGRPGGASVGGTSSSAPDRLTSSARGGEWDSGPTQNRMPGHPSPASGPRRPAPTGLPLLGPAGAPDLGLVP